MSVLGSPRVARTPRPRRLIPPVAPKRIDADRPNPARVGAWLGMVTGLGEMVTSVAARRVPGQITPDTLTTNHHYIWMVPLCNLALLGGLGVALGLVARASGRPRVSRACMLLVCVAASYAMALAIPGLHRIAVLALAMGAAWRLARWIEGDRGVFRRLMLWSSPVLGSALVVLVVVGSERISGAERRALAALPAPAPGAPNVLLIVLDTVRADALSPNAANRDTTPNLEKLAARGVRFTQAWSTSPWTLPAHASLFTGRWPHELTANVGRPLDAADPTLAEALAGRGYATAAFVANTENGNSWYGLDRGFARYEDLYENRAVTAFEFLSSSRLGLDLASSRAGRRVLGAVIGAPKLRYRKSAGMINRDLLAWLPSRGDRPFFAFLNYYDVHDPYVLPPGVAPHFAGAGGGRSRPVMEAARDEYDDCLRYLDGQLGRLFAELEGRGLMGHTLVVVTSDHGEGFGEMGLQGHGISLYRPELHVPLLVIDPSGAAASAGRTVAEAVSTRDVPDTILDLVGHDADFPGRSLARFWEGPAGAPATQTEPVLSSLNRTYEKFPFLQHVPARHGPMFSVIQDGHILIRNGDGREELYDLAEDPAETRDLAGSAGSAGALGRLRAEMSQLTTASTTGAERR